MTIIPDYGNPPGDGPLRQGGISSSTLPTPETDLPSTKSAAVKRQEKGLQIVRDVNAGNERIRECAQTYLPQDPGEDAKNYQIRLERSVFFNVFAKTVQGLTGFVFSKDPTLGEDVPAIIETHAENIDLAGAHIDVFVRDLFQDALVAGHAAILVEYPATGGSQSHRDEQGPAAPIRPYWVPIKKDDIVSWRTAVIDGRTVLTQLVIRECGTVPSGEFGEQEQTRYRVFFVDDAGNVRFRLLEITDRKEVREVEAGSYPTQVEIPVAEIITSGRQSLFESQPPLLDLAYLNIAHYQQWSDRATSMHKTCVPIYVETGTDPNEEGPLVIGPNTARRFTNPDADAKYVTHDGAALGECRQALDELKSDMAVLGLAMLSPQKRVAETADAKRIDKAASDSQLGVSARGLQDGIERALGFHARYLKLPDGGSIEINRDFEATVMDAATMTAYADLADKLGLPIRVVLEQLKAGGRIADSEDLDQLEQEIVQNKAAADQLARDMAAAQPQDQPPIQQAA